MKYADIVLNSWRSFDQFLAKIKNSEKEFLYFVRNLYVANIELESRSKWIDGPLHFLHICFSIFNLFLREPSLSEHHNILILEINHNQDKYLSERTGIPLGKINWKLKRNFTIIGDLKIFYEWIKYCYQLVFKSGLQFFPCYKTFGFLLNGLIVYSKINLEGIEKIITQRDRYPEEIGILKKAKEAKITTAKFDNFLSLGSVNHNSIYCDYYLYPNQINANHFRKYPQNETVKFIEVGFPFWDDMAKYHWNPKKDVKIITFFSQYGFDLGIFGEKGPLYYIEELISVMDDSFILFIKKHPLEKESSFKNLISERIKILKPGEFENGELFSMSTFVFSLASQALIESKHINPQSAYINYFPEESLDWDYRLLNDKLDLLQSRKELEYFLYEKKDFVTSQDFISSFNPTYPHSMEKISKVIREI